MTAKHHTTKHRNNATTITNTAKNNPNTTCWRCGKTLQQHKPHKNGKPPTWHAGHTNHNNPNSPLKPEASTCNTQHGAQIRNNQPTKHTHTHQWT